MFKKLMIGVFGLSAILLAILIGFSGGENKSKGDYDTDAMTTCNSVIPQKYPNWKPTKKFHMIKDEKSYRWAWTLSKGDKSKSITCIIRFDGSYRIKEL